MMYRKDKKKLRKTNLYIKTRKMSMGRIPLDYRDTLFPTSSPKLTHYFGK